MYMYVYVCICMYMYVYVCICMYMYVYVCICMYMYVYVCICMYMYVYVCVCVCMYVCMSVCLYVCMYVCESEILSDMYVPCWCWGDLISLTTTGDSQLRHDGCFLGGPAVVLEPKGQQWWPFGTGRIRTIYMGTLWCCSLAPIRTPHAWPTSLITRKGVALNRSVTFAGIHLSNYGELKAHSELQVYDAACYDLYQTKKSVHMHADKM